MSRPAMSRCYELIYHDGEHKGLPAFVGYGTAAPPWQPRWRLREYDGTRLGDWFRSLGRQPLESTQWLPAEPMHDRSARQLVRRRIAAILEWAGEHPPWLLNERRKSPGPVPVTCIRPNGLVIQYRSMVAAAADCHRTPYSIEFDVYTGCRDVNGCYWVVSRPEMMEYPNS